VKRNVLIAAVLWVLLISVAHIQLNVGWASLRHEVAVATGKARRELVVGFLPVT
jgi:hypothetical protein